jgi:hypothetical protein
VAIINTLRPQPRTSSSSTTSGGGTSGTLATQGLYGEPSASNQGLNQGTRAVADGTSYNRSVQDQGLVENRIVNLLKSDNPYIQQAEQAGKRYAASRGGINSLMAGNSAISQAYNAAMPIVQADAAAINAADSQNLDALNANLMQRRQIMNEATIAAANRESAQQAYQAGSRDAAEDRRFQLQMQRERLGFEGEQAGLSRAHEYGMTGYEYGLRDNMADNDAYRQDWLGNNQFNREFYGNMAGLMASARIGNASQFSNFLGQYAVENADIFSPQNYMDAMNIIGGGQDDFLSAIFASLFGDF